MAGVARERRARACMSVAKRPLAAAGAGRCRRKGFGSLMFDFQLWALWASAHRPIQGKGQAFAA